MCYYIIDPSDLNYELELGTKIMVHSLSITFVYIDAAMVILKEICRISNLQVPKNIRCDFLTHVSSCRPHAETKHNSIERKVSITWL